MRILNLSYQSIPVLPEHNVLTMDVRHAKGVGWGQFIAEAKDFKPDLIIEREWNDEIAMYEPLYKAMPGTTKAWWWIDAHINYDRRKNYAKNFDHLFFAVSRFADVASSQGFKKVSWLPLCCPWESSSCPPAIEQKDLDITFICRIEPKIYWTKRIACIDYLKEYFGSKFHFENTSNMISIVSRSRVSMNNAISDDLNFRVFEVLGCGTELVTDAVPDVYKVPGLISRVSIYRDLPEMVDKVQRVLDGRLKHDMVEAREWIIKNHCLEHRYRQLIAEATK